MKRWTDQDVREAAWRIAAGESLEDVATGLGRTPLAVKRAIASRSPWSWRELQVAGVHNRRRLTVNAYLTGSLSLAEAAGRVAMHPGAFLRYLAREELRAGQPSRPRVPQSGPALPPDGLAHPDPCAVMNGEEVRRFWSKVEKGPGCWWWNASTFAGGYGQFSLRRHNIRAHRVAWFLANGPLNADLCVCHACDHPGCVRPDHLFIGTNQDNTADKVAKGRQARGRTISANQRHLLRGRRVHAAKLTPDLVRQMRKLAADGWSNAELGRRFGVSTTAARSAVLRRTWKHV